MPRNDLMDPNDRPREESHAAFLLVPGVVAFGLIAALAALIDWAWANLPRIQ